MRITTLACAAVALAFAACGQPATATAAAPAPASAPGMAPPSPSIQGPASGAGAGQILLPSRQADRLAPPEVPPVVLDGVSYAQADDGRALGLSQSHGVLLASDAASGKPLWALAVYPEVVDPSREADVQWVFFKSMAVAPDGRLRIVNERGKAFLVDVKHRSVAPAP